MIVSTAIGSIAAILFACLVGSASYGLAALILPRAPTSTRLSSAVLAAWWILVVLFYPLASAGLFVRPVALVALGLLAAAVLHVARRRGLDLRASAIGDARGVRSALRDSLRGTPRIPLVLTALLLTLHLLRGLVSPPLAWDALTYHLVHAARWVRHGAFAPQLAPDAWGYYEFFPYAGEILWAWVMLPMGRDTFLAPAGVVVVLAVGLGSYASARSLSLTRERATLVALAILSTPAIISFTNSAYVDNTALASFALGCVFLARALRGLKLPDAALSAIGLGLSAAVKPSGLLLFAAGMSTLFLAALAKRNATSVTAPKLAAIVAAGILPWALQAIRTWFQTGSPFYPFPLRIFGRTLLPGNGQLEQLLYGGFLHRDVPRRTPFFLVDLILPSGVHSPHLNFGPSGAVIIALGVVGIFRLLVRPQSRLFAIFLFLSAVATVAMVLSPQAIALRLLWSEVTGRLIAPALFASALAGATFIQGSKGDRFWRILILVSLWFSVPAGISDTEVSAMVGLAAAGTAILALLAYGRRRLPVSRHSRTAAFAAVCLATVLFTSCVDVVRLALRPSVYEAAGSGASFVLHRLSPVYAGSWPIWQRLDKMKPQRLAVLSGWDGIGHNAYRYPLFGSHLQHELLYVTPTCSGAVLDYQNQTTLREVADLHCWLQRLLDAEVDVVVALAPKNTPESAWMEKNPAVFELLAAGRGKQSIACRFDRVAARRLLAEDTIPAGTA